MERRIFLLRLRFSPVLTNYKMNRKTVQIKCETLQSVWVLLLCHSGDLSHNLSFQKPLRYVKEILTLFLVRSSCSRCSPSSSMMSLPICSVSLAICWLLWMLWLELFRDSLPWSSKALWDCRCVCTGEAKLQNFADKISDSMRRFFRFRIIETHTLLVLGWIDAMTSFLCLSGETKSKSRCLHVPLQLPEVSAVQTQLSAHSISVGGGCSTQLIFHTLQLCRR